MTKENFPQPIERKPEYDDVPDVYPSALSQEHVVGAKLFADRYEAIASLPKSTRFAEIGVLFGDFSQHVMQVIDPSLFDAFDFFNAHTAPIIWGKPSLETFRGKTHLEFYNERFKYLIESGCMRTFQGDSSVCLSSQPNSFYDIIYLDGDHTLNGVWRDVFVATKKLKPDGFLVFNDYTMFDPYNSRPYGVVQVVNFLCVRNGWKVEYLALQADLFCDVCLRRRVIAA